MAKKNEQRAVGFETENTGGVLSGLLAEEEHLDRRAMFRLGTWGVASVGAVVIAVLANQSALRSRRDEVAALDLIRQSQQIQSVARESQNETRRLASAIDTLNGDRDRVYARLTALEQGLDVVTGAISRQNTVASPPPPATPPSVSSAAAPSTSTTSAAPKPTQQPVAQTIAPDPAPAVTAVTTTAVTTTAPATPPTPPPEKSRADASKPASPVNAMAAATTPSASAASSNPPPAPSSAPLMASKSLMAPPDVSAGKLIEPEPPAKSAAATPAPSAPAAVAVASPPPPALETPVSASASAPDKVATAELATPAIPPLAIRRTQFGVDLGGANSVGGLRALWLGLLKSRSNAPLTALEPIIVVKERDNGLGMQLRLVAGPLGDAAAAARICAGLAANNSPCETTLFDGQRLAVKANDTPATTESSVAKPPQAMPSEAKPSEGKSLTEKPSSEANSENKSASRMPEPTKPGTGKSSRRRGNSSSKRAAAEYQPQKPETSSGISSFFSSRGKSQ